jgi:hypothetical protein
MIPSSKNRLSVGSNDAAGPLKIRFQKAFYRLLQADARLPPAAASAGFNY